MWTVKEFAIRQVELDFRSAGLGRYSDRALVGDGVGMINAISYVDFDQDPVQVIVCGSCGHTQCASGGWIGLRNLETGAMLIPAFAELVGNEVERVEYAPPGFLAARGAAPVEARALAQVAELIPAFGTAVARTLGERA